MFLILLLFRFSNFMSFWNKTEIVMFKCKNVDGKLQRSSNEEYHVDLTKVNFPPDTPSSTVLAPGPPVDELPGRNR